MGASHNENGPAEAATSPSRDSANPQKGTEQNKAERIIKILADAIGDGGSVETWAALSFEPWAQDAMSTPLPTTADWNEFGKEFLPIIRIAFALMHEPKERLVHSFFSDDDVLLLDLLDDLKNR